MHRLAAALLVATTAAVVLPATASAAATHIRDAEGDVVSFESGATRREPRVDILGVDVTNGARELEIAVDVAEAVPLSDDAWTDFELQLGAFIADPDDEDSGWFIDTAGGEAALVGFDDFDGCPMDLDVDEALDRYVLRAGAECIIGLPRTIRIGVSLALDDDPFGDDFDFPIDQAPDGDLSGPIGSSGGPDVTRVAGADRVATAIALSVDRYGDGAAAAAVLVGSDDVVDGVIAGPLAAAKGGPLLLTASGTLDPRVGNEIERAIAPGSEVFLVGGTGVLGDGIVQDLRARGFRPRRIAGSSRFATAVSVAEEIGVHEMTILADGYAPRELLVASSAAASTGSVLLLTNGGHLSAPTDAFVAGDAGRHVAIGRAAFASPGAERITGSTVAELSQRVLDRLLPDVSTVGVVGPDGIGGSVAAVAHAASLNGGLVMSSREQLSGVVGAELRQRSSQLREVVVYGGTGALSEAVESGVRTAVGASSTAAT